MMILCDTGVLIAAINSRGRDHRACAIAISQQSNQLLSTVPCLTEAMYLLGKGVGFPGQEALRGFVKRNALRIFYGSDGNTNRAFDLMRTYADAPMDFADASLVVLAEVLGISQILTLDKHFYAYRIHESKPFDVIAP